MITLRQNYKSYPTFRMKNPLDRIFGGVRWLKNESTNLRSISYSQFKTTLFGSDVKDLIPFIKESEDFKWLAELPSQPLQEAVIDNDQAFERFFKRLGSYPRKQKKKGRQSFRLPQAKIKLSPVKKNGKQNGHLFIPKFKFWLPFVVHKHLQGHVSSVTVFKNPDGTYELSFVVKKEIKKFIPVKGLREIGIDLGVKHFVIMSDGTKVQAPRPLLNHINKLKRLSRSFSRMKKRGKNWLKMKLKLAKLHAKIARARKDFLHQLSTKIVRENQVICIEDLAVKNMIRNRKLSRTISDLAWGSFIAMLKYKCSWYGRSLRVIDRFYPSSKSCSECGFVNENLTLKVREWECESCGSFHDRDVNAAKNILKVGRDTSEYKPVTAKKLKRLGKKNTSASSDNFDRETQVPSQDRESEKKQEPKAPRSRKAA